MPGNAVMSAPAPKLPASPVTRRPRQSRVRSRPSASSSERSAASPNVFGLRPPESFAIVSRATGPTRVSRRSSWNRVSDIPRRAYSFSD